MPMEWNEFLQDGERCEVQYYNERHELVYLIVTKDKFRDIFYLIDVSQSKRKEITSSDNPLKLEKKMIKICKWKNLEN